MELLRVTEERFEEHCCMYNHLNSCPCMAPSPAQLRSVQEEMDSLEEEKESELTESHEELRLAQEEVVYLMLFYFT